MANKPRWDRSTLADGYQEIRLRSWKHFYALIRDEFAGGSGFIWRGQRRGDWPLESTLDRTLRRKNAADPAAAAKTHLLRFREATRGRRGPNPPTLAGDDDWWSLGQHFGLDTPLLDWTASPFVAAYFAFYKSSTDDSPNRAIYALSETMVSPRSTLIAKTDPSLMLSFIRPSSDENPRLLVQSGLFTRSPIGQTVEDWVKANFPPMQLRSLVPDGKPRLVHRKRALLKVFLPNKDREACLRELNRMNINHLTLFPDLYGAAKHTNNHLTFDAY